MHQCMPGPCEAHGGEYQRTRSPRNGVSAKLLSPLLCDSKRAHGEKKRQQDSVLYALSGQREFVP